MLVNVDGDLAGFSVMGDGRSSEHGLSTEAPSWGGTCQYPFSTPAMQVTKSIKSEALRNWVHYGPVI